MKKLFYLFILFLPIMTQAETIYLMFDTKALARIWIAEMDTLLGYPNVNTKTDTLAEPIIHSDGRALTPLKSVYVKHLNRDILPDEFLTDEVKDRAIARSSADIIRDGKTIRINRAVAKAEGWFPEEDES
jgi:hypothetical protein